MSSLELQLSPTPLLAIKGAICYTCLSTASKLNKCGRCKRVSYCSKECQRKDWKRGHQQLCHVLAGINDLDPRKDHRTWKDYRTETWMRISAFRSQQPRLPVNDERILQYQPICAVCHRSPFQLLDGEKLNLCPTCRLVHHCSSCISSQHEAQCPTFQEIRQAEEFIIQHYLETGESTIQMPTQAPKSTYTPLSSAGSWYEYYTHISDKQMITGLLSPDLKPLAGNAEMASALTAATDKSTMILTIIAALEAVFSDLSTKSTINLHLIGATGKELDALMLFEEMLHLLPLLDELHCAFVGLEMPTPQNLGETLVLDCCPGCTEAGRIRSVEMWKGAYHDYIKTGNYSKPDLAVAFHTGHSQEMIEEWTPTIKYLVNADHCTVFTTFNEKEMMEETEILKGLGARFLVRGEKNKWKGMKPMLEVIEEIENSVYYNNQYWYSTSLVKAHPG